jgi:hypothetical protein
MIAQYPQQRCLAIGIDAARLAIDVEADHSFTSLPDAR